MALDQSGFWAQAGQLANTTSTATAGTGLNWQMQNLQNQYYTYANTQVTPAIDKMHLCAPGWKYIRWIKRDGEDASALMVPIMALTTTGSNVNYVLGEATPNQTPMTPFGLAQFLAVLSPDLPYDEAEWHEKARKAYYEFHANEVAQRLLKSAAGV